MSVLQQNSILQRLEEPHLPQLSSFSLPESIRQVTARTDAHGQEEIEKLNTKLALNKYI